MDNKMIPYGYVWFWGGSLNKWQTDAYNRATKKINDLEGVGKDTEKERNQRHRLLRIAMIFHLDN